MAEIYGYVRVSTKEQNEDRQLIALREVSVPEKNIYEEDEKIYYNGSCQKQSTLKTA